MLTVVAILRAVPGKEAELKQRLLGLVAPTRAETGCLVYDLHADQNDPALFIFHEVWEDRAALERHRQAPHMKAHGAASGHLLASRDVRLMDKIS
jgi:quinol monooxygenase YgiN